MKLVNKRTGEVIFSKELLTDEFIIDLFSKDFIYFDSKLNKIIEEWEVYEEDKVYWYIDDDGEVMSKEMAWFNQQQVNIGNRFETKDEAELVVRKLNAWKLLKDFGCGFILDDHFEVKFVGPDARKITSAEEQRLLSDSYKLLFGGEE